MGELGVLGLFYGASNDDPFLAIWALLIDAGVVAGVGLICRLSTTQRWARYVRRLMAPRGAQAEAMMLEDTPIAEIDRVLVDYGFAMGHFQMMDLVGLDVIGRNATERTVMGDLVAVGRLGQKRGAGYYDYDDKRRSRFSDVTGKLIKEVAAARGIASNRTSGDEALLGRLLYPVVNEGAKILEEGIALRASDIDIAAVLGYNWPVY